VAEPTLRPRVRVERRPDHVVDDAVVRDRQLSDIGVSAGAGARSRRSRTRLIPMFTKRKARKSRRPSAARVEPHRLARAVGGKSQLVADAQRR
jgi:hypothetical protein